ncbi:MAG: T9SS type A sorting domain-containing protein [Bacteroidota bacterium]
MKKTRFFSILSFLFICILTLSRAGSNEKSFPLPAQVGAHYITVTDSLGGFQSLTFGVDARATKCLDSILGEVQLPPPPSPGMFDARFVNNSSDPYSCLGSGVNIDYHGYFNPAQVDTFILQFQPGSMGYPVFFMWDQLDSSYSGPVTMHDLVTGSIVNVDMKATSSTIVFNSEVNKVMIIASGPNYSTPSFPSAVSDSATNIGNHSATLNGHIWSDNVSGTVAFFEYGTDFYNLTKTPEIQVTNASNPVTISANVNNLLASNLYYFHAVVKNTNGSTYGANLTFRTAVTGNFIVTNPASNIHDSAATLNGLVYRTNPLSTVYVKFLWGLYPAYDHMTDSITISNASNPVTISTNISGLTPGTIYHYAAYLSDGIHFEIGNDMVFTAGGNQTSHFITINDSLGSARSITYGVDIRATKCIDRALGEIEEPPPPPRPNLDFRFVNNDSDSLNCLGQGVILDYHPYTSPAQIDTFTMQIQPSAAGYPVTFSWDNLASAYSGPVILQDVITGTIVNVDMKATSSTVVTNKGITQLAIIASGPIYTPPIFPTVVTDSATAISNHSATLNGQISTNNISGTVGYFEYGTDIYNLTSTPDIQVTNATNPMSISANIGYLSSNRIYYFHAVGKNINGAVIGAFETFTTGSTGNSVLTQPATNIHDSSATLNGSVYKSTPGSIVYAKFFWGYSPAYGHITDSINVTGATNPVSISFGLSGLRPGTTYHYAAYITDGSDSMMGNDTWFTTSGKSDTLQFTIPISIIDGTQRDQVTFGLNPLATYCIDRNLGEMEWPPIPPVGNLDFRFVDSREGGGACLGQGVKLNLHGYYSSAQTDTFLLSIQAGVAGYPVMLTWSNISRYYSGPVTISDIITGTIVNVDMKIQDSLIVTNSGIKNLQIIASGPAFIPSIPPVAITNGARYMTSTSAQINGYVFCNGMPTVAYFEWGLTPILGNTTGQYDLFNDSAIVSSWLYGLTPNTQYYYRLVAKNANGTSYGVAWNFNTLADSNFTFIKIPLTYSDSSGIAKQLWFGVHPNATMCVDSALGEFVLPPPPPYGTLDVRFVDPRFGGLPCFGNGLATDLRPFTNPAQADTYQVAMQPDMNKYNISFTWPDLNQYYIGPVILRYRVINEFPVTIDMKAQQFAIIPTGMLNGFTIMAMGPKIGPPQSDLAGWWKFDDPNDSTVIDSSPFHNNGIAHGTTLIPGVIGTARHFNGQSDYIVIPNNASLDFDSLQSFKISAWFRTTDSTHTGTILNKGTVGYTIGIENGHIKATISGSLPFRKTAGVITSMISDSMFADGLWHSVIFARIRSFNKFFLSIDGNMATQPMDDNGISIASTGYPFLIGTGYFPNGSLYFGDLDEIKIIKGEINIDIYPPIPTPAPFILSITDVPNDQGKQVFLQWLASSYQGNPVLPITHYSVWRKDAVWTFVGDVSARNDSIYGFVAPTLFDSTIVNGMYWSWFEVTAHTSNPNVFYTSPPARGYSVDNLAPHTPTGLSIAVTASGVSLHWDPPVDSDFQYFAIYRTPNVGLRLPPISPPQRIGTTTGTSFVDHPGTSAQYLYYITAVDFSGNESKPSAMLDPVTGVTDTKGLPATFALHQNYPNPFNPVTNIQYELPSTAFVTLKIYNILGEEITTLVNGDIGAGVHYVSWNANAFSSGVYQYRLMAVSKTDATKSFVQTFRMVLVK